MERFNKEDAQALFDKLIEKRGLRITMEITDDDGGRVGHWAIISRKAGPANENDSGGPVRVVIFDRFETVSAGDVCCIGHALEAASSAVAIGHAGDEAKARADQAINKAQKGGAKVWACVGTFVVHAVLIAVAALGGVPEGFAHHMPGETVQQDISDSKQKGRP